MVFINSQKFACESCIKGHRSSSCHHTDRPLFEIKKKGRPVSQCERCRELRQRKQVHSKCLCKTAEGKELSDPPVAEGSSAGKKKSRRLLPVTPALPNGIKDFASTSAVFTSNVDITSPNPRQRVDSLLNPCHCKDVWRCKCRNDASGVAAQTGLATLAHAAALFSTNGLENPSLKPTHTPGTGLSVSRENKRVSSRPNSPTPKRPKSAHPIVSPPPRHDLPPILFDTPGLSSAAPPMFPTMPSMSKVTSLAGSGCTCGFQCACPGCVEHRGSDHVSRTHSDCTSGCGDCVDRSGGIALPSAGAPSSLASTTTTSFLDRFFARAAALPPPPRNRRPDPMDVAAWPWPYPADAPVQLPKLECCGGSCGCPDGRCGCGKACNGSCAEHRQGEDAPVQEAAVEVPAQEEVVVQVPPVKKGCCCS
ncbi:hypothetical protein PLICRDRAFT_43921 [Plicaturopsis crispa FD-325 SS-3]|nr:hypothetical protein PLICRDRAFT_43921 [Plicaturopsis crispa FD-325 SS-3]